MTDTQVQAPLSSVTPEQAAKEPAFQTGTKAKPTITNEGVLAELENIYKQRKAEKEYFLNPLKQAAVGWWNPQGPGVGLPLADRMRREQDSELMDLQSKIITGKIGIGQLQNARSSLRSPETTAPQIPQTGGAPQSGGANAPVATGVSAIVPNAQGGYSYRGVPINADDFNVIQAFIDDSNKAAADAYLEKIALDRSKFLLNPSTYTQSDYFDKAKGENTRMAPIELVGRVPGMPMSQPPAPATAPTPTPTPTSSSFDSSANKFFNKEGGYNPKDGVSGAPVNYGINQKANPDVDVKTLTPEQAKAILKERYWDAIGADKLSQAAADVALDAAGNQGVSYAKKLIEKTGGDPMKMLDQREMDYRKLAKSDERQAEFLNSWLNRVSDLRKEISTTTPTTTTPTTTTPRTYSQAKQESAATLSRMESEAKTAGEGSGKRRVALENLDKTINSKLGQVSTALDILDTTPEAVGIAFRDRVTGTIISAYKAGLVPLSGQKDLEPVFAAQLPRDIRVKREQFDGLATNIAAEYRRELNQGLGQVSNYETQMSEKATGLSVTSPVEANRYFATLYLENLRSTKQMIEAWKNYPNKNDYTAFERSARYKEIQAENEERLKKIFPPQLEGGFGQPAKTTPQTRRQELDERYGVKK